MGNLGRHPDGRTILLDWAFPGRAPPATDLAWYVALNVERLPQSKDDDDRGLPPRARTSRCHNRRVVGPPARPRPPRSDDPARLGEGPRRRRRVGLVARPGGGRAGAARGRAALPDPPTPALRRAVTPRPYDRGRADPHHRSPTAPARSMRSPPPCGAAKGGDPLAPVTSIVPTNTAGVMARRALGRRGGAAAIDVLTVFRARRAARRAVAARRGPQAGVDAGRRPRRQAGHPRLARPLRRRQPPPLDRRRPARPVPRAARRRARRRSTALAAHRRAARAGAGRRRASPRLLAPSWYDEGDLLARAAERARARPARPAAGASSSTSPSGCARSRRSCSPPLGERGDVELVVGAHRRRRRRRRRRRPRRGARRRPAPARRSRAAAPAGVSRRRLDHRRRRRGAHRRARRRRRRPRRHPLRPHRRAVPRRPALRPPRRAPARPPPASRGTADRAPASASAWCPRVLAELLELDRRGLRRTDLMTLLGDVPGPRRRRARRARPPAGSASAAPPASCATRTGTPTSPATPTTCAERAIRPDAEADAALELLAFVGDLRAALGDPAVPRPWADVGRAGPRSGSSGGSGPAGSTASTAPSARRWEQTSRGARPPRTTSTRSARRSPAPSSAPRSSPSSTSRPAATARSATASTSARSPARPASTSTSSCVLGAAEGLRAARAGRRPAARRPRARGRRPGRVRPSGPRSSTASSSPPPPPRRPVLVTVPRGDLRATADAPRSRAGSPRSLAAGGRRAGRHRLPRPRPGRHRVPGLGGRAPPPRAVDRAPAPATTSATSRSRTDDAVLRRALRAARRPGRATEFTEFDGNLTGRAVAPLAGAVSPTRIETWAALPARLLRAATCSASARSTSRPTSRRSSPLDRGTAHPRRHRPAAPAPCSTATLPQPGPDGLDRRARRRACSGPAPRWPTRSHAAGRTGRAAFWVNDRAELLADARRVAGVRPRRLGRAARSLSSEQRVRRATSASSWSCPTAGRSASAGTIDRVDELPDGTLVVTDHKTGKPDELDKLSRRRPDARRHALPAPGVRRRRPRRCSAGRTPRCAPGTRSSSRSSSAVADRVRRRRLGAASATTSARVVDGIEAGVFPADPRAADAAQHYVGVLVLRARRPRHGAGAGRTGSASATTPRWPRWFAAPTTRRRRLSGRAALEQLDARSPAGAPPPAAAAGPGGPRPHPHRHGDDAVRRGRRRRRQDDRARRAHPHARRRGRADRRHRRHHVHREGGRRAAPPAPRPARPSRRRRRRAQAALDGLDHAPIGTLHAFARRILFEFPVEAGLPPGFDVLDELESQLALDERWEDLLDELLDDADREVAPGLRGRRARPAARLGRVRRHARPAPGRRGLPGQLGPRRATRVDLDPPPRPGGCRHDPRPGSPRSSPRRSPPDDTQADVLVGGRRRRHASPRRRRRQPPRRPRRASSGASARPAAVGQQDEVDGATAATRRSTRCAPRQAALGRRRRRPLRPSGGEYRRRVVGAIAGRFVLDGAARAGGRRHARVPRPARARPPPAGHRRRRARRACTSATGGCCSTSSRTPTRSSSRSPSG